MNGKITFTAIILAGFISLGLLVKTPNVITEPGPGRQEPEIADQVVESFRRDLNHEPAPGEPARGDSITRDELYQALNSVHWTRDEQIVPEEKP